MLSDRNMQAITAQIDPDLDQKTLVSWMASLNEVRNACAHHSRLWNKVLTNRPTFQNQGQLPDFDHMRDERGRLRDHHSTRLYGALMAMVFLMKRFHPRTRWHARLAGTIAEKVLPLQISTYSAGFPENWSAQRIWSVR